MKIAAPLFIALLLLSGRAGSAPAGLQERIAAITSRPALKHVLFGIFIYDLDKHAPVYAFNADKMFKPASTTKLLTEGTSLRLLGPEHRFVTGIYRTGALSADGVLDGNLVLLASGDPNLSGRVQSNDTLAFQNEDHSYDGNPDTRAVPGDPLLVIRRLAKAVAASGVKRVHGRVLVDATLFPEGEREAGTGAVISPVAVNDNIVDITLTPGVSAGAPVEMTVSPPTSYVRVINKVTTAGAQTSRKVDFSEDGDANGNRIVTITGTLPAHSHSILYGYDVPSPKRFAEVALVQALREENVVVDDTTTATVKRGEFAQYYTAENRVAVHTSPPLREDVKVTLKVSDNLHASMMPLLWGAVVAHAQSAQLQAGFDLEHRFLKAAGLDLSGAAQSDGLGGEAYFAPRFMVQYLTYMRRQPEFNYFYDALPVLGKDGTLFNIAVHSPAAGHVHAKTGTWGGADLLNHRSIVTAKGLAGYMTTRDGRHLAFCFYLNNLPVAEGQDAGHTAGQILGEIATATYLTRR